MDNTLQRWVAKGWSRAAKALRASAPLSERLCFIQTVEFPPGALARVALAFPEFGPPELALCERGFRQYASACALEGAGSGVAMPSKAIDELWHQLMLHSRFYEEFCHKAFGEFLHHEPGPLSSAAQCARPALAPCVEAKRVESSEKQDLARAWRGASEAEGLGDEGLPLLFQADALLRTPKGFIYSEDDEASAVALRALRAWARELPPRP